MLIPPHGLFALGEMAIFPVLGPADLRLSSGVLVPVDDGVVVLTGIHAGVVDVEVRALLDAPDVVDTEAWDEIVELSTKSGGDLRVTSMTSFSYTALPPLTAARPGGYRLRAHAVGRDTNWDGVAMVPVERYLFLAWPAPEEGEVMHRATDDVGRRHRDRVRSTS